MKLISMTDFLPKHPYSLFLKQPLELWMFVPCDEDGNVFEIPINNSRDLDSTILDKKLQKDFDSKFLKYQQAKERCLFEGFWIDETYKKETRQLPYLTNGIISVFLHSDFAIRHQFVEDLTDSDIQLTQTAIKQLGL